MSTLLAVAAAIAAAYVFACVVLFAVSHLSYWWERRRRVVGECEVCGVGLRRHEVRELRESWAADDRFGGTSITATYCRRHAPPGAVALRR